MALKLQKYPFLEVISEAEAVTRGVNLSDKIAHLLFKNIRSLSTPENASRSMLYSMNVTIQEIASHSQKEIANVLKKLINEKVLAQIFRIDFDADNSALAVVPSFIALPQEDKFKPEMLFQETILHSVKSIESYLDSLAVIEREDIWKNLETDFSSDKIPAVSQLSSVLTDLFSSVDVRKFDVPPSPEMIRISINEMEEELIYRGKIVRINDYGLMHVRDKDYLLKLETAGDFVITRMIPKYRGTGNLKHEIGQVTLEEAHYYMDPFAQPTSKFIAKKTDALKKAILSSPSRKNEGVRFPGSLAVEMVLSLDKHSSPRYEEKQLTENRKELEKWRSRIKEISPSWMDNYHIISESEFMEVPPFVRNQIMEDTDFIHGEWELQGETMHVFFLKESSVIRQFAKGMQNLPASSNWQILLLKNLLDKNELFFKDLFLDPSFLNDYGRMLRHAYARYISFFYRILDFFGIRIFQNQAYQNAKRKIMTEQQTLSLRNKEIYAKKKEQIEEEKKERLGKIKSMESSLKIIEKLDQFYLAEKKIPTVEEVRNALKLTDPISFREILSEDSFQTVSMGGGQDGNPDNAILVYPLNYEWRARAGRLHRIIDSMIESYSVGSLNPLEEIQLERAKKMNKFLSKKEKPSLKKSDGEDPYEKLDKEIQKQKKSRVPDEDELEI
ncbi:MAG: hypothetical protein OEZ34_02255 [Spirochaetia bacterium]|nr:hypothetical protein [Spirochaetia bacterium]